MMLHMLMIISHDSLIYLDKLYIFSSIPQRFFLYPGLSLLFRMFLLYFNQLFIATSTFVLVETIASKIQNKLKMVYVKCSINMISNSDTSVCREGTWLTLPAPCNRVFRCSDNISEHQPSIYNQVDGPKFYSDWRETSFHNSPWVRMFFVFCIPLIMRLVVFKTDVCIILTSFCRIKNSLYNAVANKNCLTDTS